MKLGDKLPQFKATDQDFNAFDSSSLEGKPVVVFFYPKDHSPGCTKEVCAFRDRYDDMLEAGASVIGVSPDSAESHRKFQENNSLRFPLLCDKDGKLRKLFNVSKSLFGLISGRETFVFDESGTLIHHLNSQLQFEQHAHAAAKKVSLLASE